MLEDAVQAANFPRGDLSLGFCQECGFFSNTRFDASLQSYAAGYEDQQIFSDRFRRFQAELIDRIIERYDVRGKDIVEIGCGKGDFLIELCAAGGNRGVGIDPACDRGRVEQRRPDAVRFLPELYAPHHADLPCGFLCCRHTLEHIHDPSAFLARVREALGPREDVIVFFEVPDALRVLSERAFWDVYYEHCSYFTPSSMARLFQDHGFDVLELYRAFDEQYLMLFATPVREPDSRIHRSDDDVPGIGRTVDSFREDVPRAIETWRRRIIAFKREGKRLALWGSGSKCVSFLCTMGPDASIDRVIDINPHRQGKYLAGSAARVSPPGSLRDAGVDVVLVMNPAYRSEVAACLREMEIEAEVYCL